MKYIFSILWALIAIYFCQLCINNSTANTVIQSPEVGYRFETNRDILIENNNITLSIASCTKFSVNNQDTNEIIYSNEDPNTPLGWKGCSPYYKITNLSFSTGIWKFTGGISEYEVLEPNESKLSLVEPEISQKYTKATMYLLFSVIWICSVAATNLYNPNKHKRH